MLTETLIKDGMPRMVAYGIEQTLLFLHSDLCRMTDEQRKKFWEVSIRQRVLSLAIERNMNQDLF